jgi:hypothetical protein
MTLFQSKFFPKHSQSFTLTLSRAFLRLLTLLALSIVYFNTLTSVFTTFDLAQNFFEAEIVSQF